MRTHDHAEPASQQGFDDLVRAQVEQAVLLPRRSDEHDGTTRPGALGSFRGLARLVGRDLPIEQVVAAFHEIATRDIPHLPGPFELRLLVRAHAQNGVVVVESLLRAHQVRGRHMVEHIHVLDVFANIRTLDVEILQIVQRHHGNVAIELHHERDQALVADVVRYEAGICLMQLEHLVVGIAGNVVNARIGVRQQPFDGALEVLVEAAALGVEHDMLADHAHEALVVLLLALRQRIALVPRRFTRRESVELVQLHTTCSEFGIVDILRWPHDQVAQGLHHDGHQVRAYPVEGHAGGHVHAQDEGQHDGQPVSGVLLHLRLLALQRVDPVLREAHHHRGQTGQKRHDPRKPSVFNRHHAQELGSRSAVVGDAVNHFHQSEQHENLRRQRNERQQRMIVVLLVQQGLLLADGFGVAEVLHFDAVELRHDLDHDDAVPLAPKRQRHENDLDDHGEQQNGHPPASCQIVARLNDVREKTSECF